MTNLQKKALMLYCVERDLKELQQEREALREYLQNHLGEDELVQFDTTEGPFRVKNCATESRVLKEPNSVLHYAGPEVFLKAVSVSVGKFEKALKEKYHDPTLILNQCTKMIERKTCLKLLRGRK